jgi:hypothetical protein
MTVNVTSPITGSAQTGFTAPTYTHVADVAPTAQGKQIAITAIGGTQAGVDTASTASRPFTLSITRPAVIKSLSPVDPVTGQLRSVPRNTYTFVGRKGVTPLAGQASVTAILRVQLDVPAGADLADAPNIRALISMVFGAINQVSAGFGDSAVSGVI